MNQETSTKLRNYFSPLVVELTPERVIPAVLVDRQVKVQDLGSITHEWASVLESCAMPDHWEG